MFWLVSGCLLSMGFHIKRDWCEVKHCSFMCQRSFWDLNFPAKYTYMWSVVPDYHPLQLHFSYAALYLQTKFGTNIGVFANKLQNKIFLVFRSTVFQPKQKFCIILFGIPNFIVEYAAEIFTNDALQECMFMLDPSYGQSPSVDIFFKEMFSVMHSAGMMRNFKSQGTLYQKCTVLHSILKCEWWCSCRKELLKRFSKISIKEEN